MILHLAMFVTVGGRFATRMRCVTGRIEVMTAGLGGGVQFRARKHARDHLMLPGDQLHATDPQGDHAEHDRDP